MAKQHSIGVFEMARLTIEARCTAQEVEMANWSEAEHRFVVWMMRWLKILTMIAAWVVFLAAMAAPALFPVSGWEPPKTLGGVVILWCALGVPYIMTAYVRRIFELRRLIGPLAWLRHFPGDLFEVAR